MGQFEHRLPEMSSQHLNLLFSASHTSWLQQVSAKQDPWSNCSQTWSADTYETICGNKAMPLKVVRIHKSFASNITTPFQLNYKNNSLTEETDFQFDYVHVINFVSYDVSYQQCFRSQSVSYSFWYFLISEFVTSNSWSCKSQIILFTM